MAGMQASLKQSRPKREFSIRIRSWKLSLDSLVPQVVVPKLWMKRISKCTCMHLLTHPRRHGAFRESMWILHACLFTIEFSQSTLVSTQTFLLIFTSLWVDCSNNSSFWVSRVIPRVQRIRVFRETVCPIPDASRRPAMSLTFLLREMLFFFWWRVVRVISSTGCWQQRPAAWNQQQEERIGIYWNKPTNNTYLHCE